MSSVCPRLRPLEIFPTEQAGHPLYCLRDPSGLTDRLAFVPPAALRVLALCDGTRTVDDVVSEYRQQTGMRLLTAQVVQILEELDQGFFLCTPRFSAHREALLADFRRTPRRKAAHAGTSYPADPKELSRFLESLSAGPASDSWGGALPKAILAPHIDFARGGAVYQAAYRPLQEVQDRPDLVVVFGTDHNGAKEPFTLTKKSYETPLGVVETDTDLVSALAAARADEGLFAEEFHHRAEHSIEFQAVWLRHVYGDHVPPILPILCGSLNRAVDAGQSPLRERLLRDFLVTLREMTQERRVLVLAGADLAHVGPRFGDAPYQGEDRERLAAADRAALGHASRGDAENFFGTLAKSRNRFRVCGLPPIFATLSYMNGTSRGGELLAYEQCLADELGTSFVSIAALAWH